MSFTASIHTIVAENYNGLLAQASHWTRVRLGDLAAFKNGEPLAAAAFNSASGPFVIRIRNILDGRSDTRFSGEVQDSWYVEPGDLLVGMDGDFNAAIWTGPRSLLNQRVCRVKPHDRTVSTRYLSFILPGYLAAINKHTQSITVKHLSSRTIAELPIPVPPRPELDRLVAAIETQFTRLDSAVATLERVRANLKRARASILKAAVEGRLVPTEAQVARAEGRPYEPAKVLMTRILEERKARWPKGGKKYIPRADPDVIGYSPVLPEGWGMASADQAGDILLGRRRAPEYTGEERRYFRVANVKDDRLDVEDVLMMPFEDTEFSKYTLVPGDILLSEGQSPELLGQSAVYRGECAPAAFQATLHRFRATHGLLDPAFAQILFRAWVRLRVRRARLRAPRPHPIPGVRC